MRTEKRPCKVCGQLAKHQIKKRDSGDVNKIISEYQGLSKVTDFTQETEQDSEMMNMKTKKIRAFKCPDCGELHEEYDDAVLCCAIAEEVEAFKCGECDSIYSDREEAKDCCK